MNSYTADSEKGDMSCIIKCSIKLNMSRVASEINYVSQSKIWSSVSFKVNC